MVKNKTIVVVDGSNLFHRLKELNFNYLTYTIVSISSTLFYLLFLPIAGKFSDKYGNLTMLKICSFLLPLVPIAWIFSSSPVYLEPVFTGFAAVFNRSPADTLANGMGTFTGGTGIFFFI